MIDVNLVPQTLLTKIFSATMSKRSKRSAIIDVSSVAGMQPLPMRAAYSATKSFNFYLNRALSEEFLNFNIDFLVLKPGYVASEMSKMVADGIRTITPTQCVSGTLNDLGYEGETNGYWVHKIHGFLIERIPRGLSALMFRRKKKEIKDLI